MKFNSIIFSSFLIVISICYSSCRGNSKQEIVISEVESLSSFEKGKLIYQKYCIVCHGYDGSMGNNGAYNLQTSTLSFEEKQIVVRKGRNTMTPFEKVLKEEEIYDVVKYIHAWTSKMEQE